MTNLTAQGAPELPPLPAYDAGLLSDFGGGSVDWWQDYIRAELGRAHDFYESHFADRQARQAAPEALSDEALSYLNPYFEGYGAQTWAEGFRACERSFMAALAASEAEAVKVEAVVSDLEADDYATIMRLGDLLDEIARVLRGEPKAGVRWGYADLPDRVRAVVNLAADLASPLRL